MAVKVKPASYKDEPPGRTSMTTKTFLPDSKRSDHFGRFATSCSLYLGSRWAFAFALGVIVSWAATGPFFKYSDTWQLVINTGTTIVTFLMVFLIQNTQNRDARAINLKLDELIDAISSAKNQMIDIEHLSDAELDVLAARYETLKTSPSQTSSSQSDSKNSLND